MSDRPRAVANSDSRHARKVHEQENAMSMINTGQTLAPTLHLGHNRSRISWGAILAGAIVAVATTLLLSLLGAAMGASSIHALDTTSTDLANYGAGAAIWEIINLALSMAFGGYIAARLSGTHSHLDAELHGVGRWLFFGCRARFYPIVSCELILLARGLHKLSSTGRRVVVREDRTPHSDALRA